MWAYTAHFGDFGGPLTKVIWVVLGLIPAGLTVTGYLMWWNRVLKKKWDSLSGTQEMREQWSLSKTLPETKQVR
jgi:uncharacterized iron-regulated membrane protein